MEEIKDSDKFPPEEELEHYNSCDGCDRCDHILSIFGHCYCCHVLTDKKELYYDHPAGDYYCEDCIGAMPDDNTNNFVLCGNCKKRDGRKNMFQDHYNFYTAWTCYKCVSESIINDRFEILDL